MKSNTVSEVAIFSFNDFSRSCERVDHWAVERALSPYIVDGMSILDAMAEPRFSKVELLLAFEATLDNMLLDALN